MGLVNTKDKSRKEKELAAISQKIKKTKLKPADLIIPLASGVIFVILSFAVFVPMVTSAIEYLGEMKEVDDKKEKMDKLNKKLDAIDENQLNEDVLIARQVIPKKLLVSNFVYYLDELAKQKSLTVSELSSSDSTQGVSGPLGYSGDYDNVIAFLDEVQSVSPYMIRLENVEVAAKDEGTWDISLKVSGFYINESTEEPDIYAPFTPYIEYIDVVEIFKKKAESLD